jgi:polyhydroxyalkanoate synthase subunit PhaC
MPPPMEALLEALPQSPASDAPGLPADLIAGVAAYRRHPWRRTLDDPPAIWNEGGSRLLDYGRPGGRPVLFVPSLVNRAHILDLDEGRSMLRHLAARHRVLLLDWGWPGQDEQGFTLTDYIAGRLERAIAAVGAPVVLAGYCMGGLLSLAAAQRRPDRVAALALLATPWDFHAADAAAAQKLAGLLPWLEPLMTPTARLPIDAIQTLFALLDPWGIAAKYAGFARIDPDSARARQFVAIEDWLNDGVPLAAAVARECIAGWYGANTPAAGAWRIAGEAVDPARLRLPAFVAIPARDRIVPPESARPLADIIPGAVLHAPASGHVGMVAGGSAERALWQPLHGWLDSL